MRNTSPVRKINARRLATQHAADALWPYTDESNLPPPTPSSSSQRSVR
jgi:hypothetical protein